MNNVIIFGPQGCGKTRNGEALRKHYGLSRVVDADDFERQINGGHTVALSGNLILANDAQMHGPGWSNIGRVINFDTAMKEAGL